MRSSKWTLLALLIGLAGCRDAGEEPSAPLSDAELRARTSVIYASVDMYKPAVGDGVDFDVYQAPMFYREHPEGEATIDQDSEFGWLSEVRGELVVSPSSPAVYFQRGKVTHGAIEHDQVTFLWLRTRGAGGPIAAQGLRLTYDSAGFPAIFEVLEDASGKSLFYVSASLETLAFEQHGELMEGRTFAVERSLEEAASSLVVRQVKQGGQPLGPLVYDGFTGADIVQLHCRCTNSQLKAIGEAVDYELIPVDAVSPTLWEQLVEELGWGDAAGDLGFPAPVWPLASLRLPDAF